ATSPTQTGQIPGTGKFMAPELWAGEPADERSDLYAAGVVLSQSIGDDASPAIHDLVDRMTAHDPTDRPASATAALAELGGPGPPPTAVIPPDPPPEPTVVAESGSRSHRGPAIAGLALVAAVAVFAIAQAVGGGDDDPSPSAGQGNQSATANNQNRGDSGSGSSGSGSSDSSGSGSGKEALAEAPSSGPPASETTASGDGAALNDQGYALLQAGDAEGAVPILEQAVNAFPEDSTDINYAYALYNYADALMQTGRPDEAIPYLEKRLTFDDQTETVQATLDEARAAAGQD
ncbi:MAG: tetratricopeptide repeat-containing serine/threonine-protein kinase, partial [Actinomycetota bacterium]|nr:tetratricopeptide repeat-containing serine/threonine-protein kinase [Actinomycetota bacterium]